MKRFKILAAAACALCLSVGLAACGEDQTPQTPQTPHDPAPSETTETVWYLSPSSQFFPTYDKKEDVPAEFLFSSSAEDVFTLTVQLGVNIEYTLNKLGSEDKIGYSALFSSEGKLAEGTDGALSCTETGTFVLTLDTSSAPILTYSFTAPTPPPPAEKTVVSVTLTRSNTNMKVGQVDYFFASVLFSDDSTSDAVTWSSSDTNVISVEQDGKVTALSAGTSTVTASAGEKSASVDVTVTGENKDIPVTGIELDKEELVLELEESYTFHVTFTPENATDKRLIWQSGSDQIATVENGVVKAVNSGRTTITCNSVSGGQVASCTVTVRRPVSSIDVQSALTLVAQGSEKPLSVRVLPANATYKTYTVEATEGGEHVSIRHAEDGTAYLTGVSAGEATLKVTSTDNPEATAECTVTVLAAGEVVADLDATTLTVPLNTSKPLTAILDGESITSVSWTSSNQDVASVAKGDDVATGLVTGNKFGTATITATINSASGSHTVKCTVFTASDYFYISGSGTVAGEQQSWDSGLSMDDANNAQRLLQETEPGVYTLTRHFKAEDAFQIIFPEIDTEWTLAINPLNDYYQVDAATSQYLGQTSDSKNVLVNLTGTYTVTLDLTAEKPYFTVKLDAIDVTGATLNVEGEHSGTLIKGQTESTVLALSVNPTNAQFDHSKIEWWVESNYADWLSLTPSEDRMTCTVTLLGATSSNASPVRIYCSVGGNETYYTLAVVPEGAAKRKVQYIIADPKEVAIDVADGWAGTVHAYVNEDATVRSVAYTAVESSGIEVNSATGEVTVSALGVYHVKAASTDAPAVKCEITVYVYSSNFYLAGVLNGEDKWETDNSATYGFEQISYQKFVIRDVTLIANDQFKVVYSGLDEAWNKVISYKNLDTANSSGVRSGTDNGVAVSSRGAYTITVTLGAGGELPVLLVERTGDGAPENTEDFEITVLLYGREDLWQGEDKPLAGGTATLSPKNGNLTITFQCTFSTAVWAQVNFATRRGEGSSPTFYESTTNTIAFSGSKYSSSGSNCWRNTGDILYREGSQAQGTFTFTVTFNGDGVITAVAIN